MDKEVEWILPFFRLELEALGYETIIGRRKACIFLVSNCYCFTQAAAIALFEN